MSDLRASKWVYRLAVPLGLGAVAGWLLPMKFFNDITQELIALLGLMMAAVLPAMVLNASILRPAGLSVLRIRQYEIALVKQVRFWAYLFLVSLMAAGLIVFGKSIGWSLTVTLPALQILGFPGFSAQFAPLLNATIVAFLAAVLMRAKAVVDGITSLINLSADLAVSEAQQRNDLEKQEMLDNVAKMEPRPGYGDYLNLSPPH